MIGRIICIISSRYTVLFEDGSTQVCVARGKLRKGTFPVVGDFVEVKKFDDAYGIEKICERKNYLIRPLIANVDQAIIVMSCKDPDFSTTLIDRLIFLISHAGITPKIVITKLDLISDEDEIYQKIEEYRKSGYEVVLKSDKEALDALFKGKISVLTGQSGAGKSSLLNALDASLQLPTQEISKALGRGKHTTRHVELLPLKEGYIADTPGFSSLDFTPLTKRQLADCVPDFKEHACGCRFNDCIHENEPGCAVKEAVSSGIIPSTRYEHYLECLKLCKGKDYEL